jgi:hypothetical protein
MTELTYLFGAVALLAGVTSSISIWAPRRVCLKAAAVATAMGFMAAVYLAFLHLLSMPKPIALEWWHAQAEQATVLGSSLREDDGIYLWLQIDGTREPRAYVLPWSRELAEQLQDARRKAEHDRSELQMRLPFERSFDNRDPKFYALPQPALPPKDRDRAGPQFYERPKLHAQDEI